MEKVEKIAIQMWSVRTHLNNFEQAKQTFKKLKELGYDEAQTAGMGGLTYDEYYTAANEAGIEIVGTHGSLEEMESDIETVIENHKKLHTTNMGIGSYARDYTVEIAEDFIERVNKIAKRLAKDGMKFTYHNHCQEFIKLENGKTAMEMFAEGFDENVSFVLDTYWVQHAGADICSWIEKLAGRIDILHLKDMRVERSTVKCGVAFHCRIAEIGNGNMDWNRIIDTALKTGVKYFCVEQDDCPIEYEPSLKFSSDYLHKNFM